MDVSEQMNTYPEMNAKIVGILRASGDPTCLYAAQRIEELEKALMNAVSPSLDAPPTTCDLPECWHHVKVFSNGDKRWSCSNPVKSRTGQPGCPGFKERKVGTA